MSDFLTRRGLLIQLAATGFMAACAGSDKGEGEPGTTGDGGGSGDSGGSGGSGVGGGTGSSDDTGFVDGDDTGMSGDDTGMGGDDTGEVEADPCDVDRLSPDEVEDTTPFAGEGPNYLSGQPETDNINVRGEEGFKLWVYGQVFDRNKEPIPGARVDIWQADQKSNYNLSSSDFHGHGYQTADDTGAYCFETLRPPPIYSMEGELNNVAHIHFKVWVDDVAIQTFQMYFDDDPTHADEDMPLPEQCIKSVEVIGDNEGRVRFDFVLDYPRPPA